MDVKIQAVRSLMDHLDFDNLRLYTYNFICTHRSERDGVLCCKIASVGWTGSHFIATITSSLTNMSAAAAFERQVKTIYGQLQMVLPFDSN